MRTIAYLIGALMALIQPPVVMAQSQTAGTIVMEFDLSAHPADQEARLWIPYPVSDQDQLITDISVSGDFAESGVYTDRTYSTPILYARWDKGASERRLTLSFHAVRREVVKKDFPTREDAWNPADHARYLAPTRLGPVDGPVKALADEITVGKTTVLAKARAIYDWICDNMHRDPSTRGCGAGDVCLLLLTPGGKCTDIHSVFVALCRAAGVPAREVFGIRMGKEAVADISAGQHCWAEFFLPGFGWVPVDPADVLKAMLTENLAPEDARAKEYREYFWGAWDSYRVKLAMGRDLLLNPRQEGAPLNTFGYPYAEVGGKALDWLDPKGFRYTFAYRR